MLRGIAPWTLAATLLVGSAAVLTPQTSAAFCGFYVAGADAELFSNATVVVLMRDGKRTVLSMQNDYQGPPEDFALVIPVPVVLQEDDVKVLRPELFERVETLASPRLVEYWEQDPCELEGTIGLGNTGLIGRGGGGTGSGYGGSAGILGVVVEAEFSVGEYEIVILSAKESGGLDTWLRANDYNIPAGAGPLLQPYIEQGMKFFVAKVDPKKVKFDGEGRAQLSPLRFHYDSDDFALPIRLGLINAPDPSTGGKQDLLVHILAPQTRYEVANYPNVTIPTNLEVEDAARDRFGSFYVSLFDHTLAQHPGAVVTEYAWGASSCDPCPGPDAALTPKELSELGADVLYEGGNQPSSVMVPTVLQADLDVQGPLDRDLIRRIVRAHSRELNACYGGWLVEDSTLAGRVDLEFTINTQGTVGESSVASSSLTDPRVARCMAKAVRRWHFPKPRDAEVRVAYGFELSVRASLPSGPSPFVLTRLHARYDASSLGEDLVFETATPIVGGREFMTGDGQLERGASPSRVNNFQGRYAIRHRWAGEVTCDEPVRGRWGGPPEPGSDDAGADEDADEDAAPIVARQLSRATRGAALTSFVSASAAAQLGLSPGEAGEAPPATPTTTPATPPTPPTPEDPAQAPAEAKPDQPKGCSCTSAGSRPATGFGDLGSGLGPSLLALLGLLGLRRRRS